MTQRCENCLAFGHIGGRSPCGDQVEVRVRRPFYLLAHWRLQHPVLALQLPEEMFPQFYLEKKMTLFLRKILRNCMSEIFLKFILMAFLQNKLIDVAPGLAFNHNSTSRDVVDGRKPYF